VLGDIGYVGRFDVLVGMGSEVILTPPVYARAGVYLRGSYVVAIVGFCVLSLKLFRLVFVVFCSGSVS